MLYQGRRPAALVFAAAAIAGATVLAGCSATSSTPLAGPAPVRTHSVPVSVGAPPATSPGRPPAGWKTAQEVPCTATLNNGAQTVNNVLFGAIINSLSCGSAGNCSAGGQYTDSAGKPQALVVSEVNGIWQSAEEVPGIAALNQGETAGIKSVSCPSAGNCSAGGFYGFLGGQVFVVSSSAAS